MGLQRARSAGLSRLVPRRQGHPKHAQRARQSPAGYLRAQPVRILALVREEPRVLECEAAAGAHSGRRAQQEREDDRGGN